jgi:flagellar hook assembly protein FlgD
MAESPTKSADKTEIIAQIADLSKLLGMIPSDDTVTVNEPVTQKSMELSKWFDDTRKSFLKLSILLDKTLDLNLQ